MRKSELAAIIDEVDRQLEAGEITKEQHEKFMIAVRDHALYTEIIDPVWEKSRRPITKPRAHKNHPKYDD